MFLWFPVQTRSCIVPNLPWMASDNMQFKALGQIRVQAVAPMASLFISPMFCNQLLPTCLTASNPRHSTRECLDWSKRVKGRRLFYRSLLVEKSARPGQHQRIMASCHHVNGIFRIQDILPSPGDSIAAVVQPHYKHVNLTSLPTSNLWTSREDILWANAVRVTFWKTSIRRIYGIGMHCTIQAAQRINVRPDLASPGTSSGLP